MTEAVARSSSSSWKKPEFLQAIIVVLVGLVIVLVRRQPQDAVASTGNDASHGELLIGYKLLRHYISLEGDLKYLKVLRKITFRGPSVDLDRIITRLHQISSYRTVELDSLFQLELPVIHTKDAPTSMIGEYIQNTAEQKGKLEMIAPGLGAAWPVRFYLLQAQATRMIAAIATSTSKLETNPERKRWLKAVAKEYELLRETIVEALDNSCGEFL